MSNEGGVQEARDRVNELIERFSALTDKIDQIYVRKDSFDSYKELAAQVNSNSKQIFTQELASVESRIKTQIDLLESRVKELEGDKQWLTRLVLSFVVLGVLLAVFVVSRVGQ